MEILDGAVAAGATAGRVAKRMAISLRTLQRWRRQFAAHDASGGADGGGGGDRRKGSTRHVPHRLSDQERQRILAVCNQPQYASLPPAQIVPDLADQGVFLASESSFYRVLHAHQQVQRRGRARPGLIQSLSQALLSGLRVWAEVGGIAPFLCLKAPLPQPIST